MPASRYNFKREISESTNLNSKPVFAIKLLDYWISQLQNRGFPWQSVGTNLP